MFDETKPLWFPAPSLSYLTCLSFPTLTEEGHLHAVYVQPSL